MLYPFDTFANEEKHKSLDEFEFWPDLTTDYGVSCPVQSVLNRCRHFFSVAIDLIHFKFEGNKDMNIISDELKIRPDRKTNCGVICP